MRLHSCSRFGKGKSLSLLSTGWLLISLMVPTVGLGRQLENLPRAKLGVEISSPDVIDTRPVELKQGEGPRITGTAALKVERLEKFLDGYRLWVKNRSDKNIVAYTISTDDNIASRVQRFMQVGGEGQGTVLAAGAISPLLYLSSTWVEGSGIKVLSVIFEDGSFEGDPKIATHFQANDEGVRIQSPAVLRMIEQTLKVPDSDLRAEFDKLEAGLWVIPEAMGKPSALVYLKTKFPAHDEQTINDLYESLKGGLYDARNIALSDIGGARRHVLDLEERSQFASAVEAIRTTLERLRETFGKITSAHR